MAMLADCIETKIDPIRIKVNVTDVGAESTGVHIVDIDADPIALLAAEVLGYQRDKHKLTLAQVAAKMGSLSTNAYAAYERGAREPTLTKFRELLAVVAPEISLRVVPRAFRKPRRKTA
jgi:hypothetical protein